ncbi:hypothetical protein MAPG_03665 [Magnaporthiopsis poae ATCC 64411]|uniref:BTB domain-containing protein n=1 Tax=Magnaporthiopsis poae (strain ATCC 64411 / 73-15) TaxID=644358 RepID=A0A0C4DUM5_MAGP6|nr:hypothetical protein MAPG_03665 [Magnaporthiopsis poae ATCC 64411]
MAASNTSSSSTLSLTPSSSPSPSPSPPSKAMAQLPPAESFDESGDLQLLVGAEGLNQARFIVCSRALSRLSPVFKSMLAASLAEQRPDGIRDAWTVKLPRDHPESVRIILALAHGALHQVPRHMSLESLYRLCTCINQYDISEALKPWVSGWCAGDKSQRSAETGPEARAKELWIAWVLGNAKMQRKAAQILFLETQSSEVAAVKPLDPTGVVDHIAKVQLETAREIVSAVQTFWLDLMPAKEFGGSCAAIGDLKSKQDCEAATLGFVTAALSREGFLPNAAPKIYESFQVKSLSQAATRIAEDKGTTQSIFSPHGSCRSGRKLGEKLDKVMHNLPSPVPEFAQRRLAKRAKEIGAWY